MALQIEDLQKEKNLLQKDFDELRKNNNQTENSLNQMKANSNAVNGAIQQINKLIAMILKSETEPKVAVKSKAKKNEKV